jgi:hypothetical protein
MGQKGDRTYFWEIRKDSKPLRLNGCPRKDPRQNFAGLDAIRERDKRDEKIEDFSTSETPVNWEFIGALVDGSKGLLMGHPTQRREGSFSCRNS